MGLIPIITPMFEDSSSNFHTGFPIYVFIDDCLEEGDKRMTQIERYKCYLDMMNQWLILLQEKKSICSYIEKEGWRFVAVYGMSNNFQIQYLPNL